MKILFIYPPQSPYVLAPSNFEPLALEILASTVSDHNVKILDLRFESLSILRYLLRSYTPDLIGVTINNTMQVNQALRILKFIRETYPSGINIVGGHHPSLAPQDFYVSYVDAIFVGWAEKSFPQYVDALQSNKQVESIPGVIVLKNGIATSQTKNAGDISPNDIPLPNRSLVQKYRKRYKDEIGRRTVLVNTARGCPYRCTFCACWKAAFGRYIVRSAEDVFKELTNLPAEVSRVFFADDNTFFDIQRAEDLYRLIKKSGMKKKYSGYCRSDTIVKHPSLFYQWKEIGLDNLTIGFEATGDEMLKNFNKAGSTEVNQKAVRILDDLDLKFSSYFLIDPDFKAKDFREISDFVNRLNLIRPKFVILTPLPGTLLYEKKKSEINLSYDYFDFMHWVVPTKLNAKEFYKRLIKLYYKAYSFRRHLKIFLRNKLNRPKSTGTQKNQIKYLPFVELVLLRITAYPLRRKLYKQYFGSLPITGK